MMSHCCICGTPLDTVIEIENRDIIGMAKNYTHRIGICPACELIVTMNPFSQTSLTNRYKHHSKFEFDVNDGVFEGNHEYRHRMQRIKSYIDWVIGLENIGSIFEVGASSGYNLSLYENMDRFGVEPSEANAKSAKANYGIDLFAGDFDDYMRSDIRKNRYDLIFLSMTLEHIVNPYDFIMKLSEFNNKYMFIEVPTFDYKFSNEPYGMFCEEHVNMFTLKSLQKLMNQCGYQLIDASIHTNPEINLPAGWPGLDSVWEKKSVVREYRAVNDVRALLDAYIRDSKDKLREMDAILDRFPDDQKLAVWGTGHHASMLYCNTALGRKNIVKVYDSDKRKHGLEMFDCVIEPFNPHDIMDKKVDGILLATYTARKPLRSILEKYAGQVEIIDLYQSCV